MKKNNIDLLSFMSNSGKVIKTINELIVRVNEINDFIGSMKDSSKKEIIMQMHRNPDRYKISNNYNKGD